MSGPTARTTTPNASPGAPAQAFAPLEGSARVWGTLALSAATFMNVLDSSIANVSLPAIAGDLGVSPNQGTWVITSFAVANAISLPLTGWLSQRFGQVRLFVASVILFVLASWLCGLAPNMATLIGFRALQGFVAGPMIPLSQTLLLASYPRAMAGTAMAMWGMTTLVAPVMGPLLGGWITDNMSWPWIFYINIPVGLTAGFAAWAIYHKRESDRKSLPIDSVGLALLVVWVGALQIMLDIGKENDWFHSWTVIACAVTAGVAFVFFLAWELTEEHPVVDLTLFKLRNFWAGSTVLAIAYGLFFGNVVLMPLWLQQYMGYTATQAGMVTAPIGLMAIIFSPFVGKTIVKVDPRKYASFAFMVFGAVLWMRSRFSTDADMATLMVPTIIQGVGMAFFFIPLVTLTLSGIPPERTAGASGLSNFMRITAGAMGTSISTTLWENRASVHHAHMSEAITQGRAASEQAFAGLGSLGMSPQQSLAFVNRLVDQQAFMLAADDVFFLSSMIFLALIPCVWITRRMGAAQGAGDSAAGAH
jgi:DHA2 family multidrug resistance protein